MIMKKFAILFLTALLACPLFANEAAVRKVLNDINEASRDLQVKKMLTHYDKNFIEISADGEIFDYTKAETMVKAMEKLDDPAAKLSDFMTLIASIPGAKVTPEQIKAIKVIENPNAKLSELLVAAHQLNGASPDPEMLAQYKAFDDTPQGKELVRGFRTKFGDIKSLAKAEMKKAAEAEADSFKIVSVKVNGNKAVVVYTGIKNKRNLQSTINLVKKAGKWLIVKSVAKYI